MSKITDIRMHGSTASAIVGGAALDDPSASVAVLPSHLGGTIRPNRRGMVMVWLAVPVIPRLDHRDLKIIGARIDHKTNLFAGGRGGEVFVRRVDLVRDGGEVEIARINDVERLPSRFRSNPLAEREFAVLDRSFFANGDGVKPGASGVAFGIQVEFNPREPANPDATFTLFSAGLSLEVA